MEKNKLSGKNVLITGTSQGIGAAISKWLIESGCNICMHYFHSEKEPGKLKAIAEARNQKAIHIKADLTDENELIRCVRTGAKFLGTIDVLVNNSGSLVQRRYLQDIDNAFLNTLIDINLRTMLMVTKEAFPFFNRKEGTSIINVASLAGRAGGHQGSLIYSTVKGAVLTWTRALAKELGPEGIRVNAVAPGFIEGTSFHAQHTTRESAVNTIKNIPLGRSGNPDDVARAVVFLASEYDGFITGATIDINGGIYCF